jgi:hypothetical protein
MTGGDARLAFEVLGRSDVSSKSMGSNNPFAMVHADLCLSNAVFKVQGLFGVNSFLNASSSACVDHNLPKHSLAKECLAQTGAPDVATECVAMSDMTRIELFHRMSLL